MNNIKILAPAKLGDGINKGSLIEGLKREPDLIVVDAGFSSYRPYCLGKGKSYIDRYETKKDIGLLLKEAVNGNIPIIIGNAGGAGARIHLEWMEEIIRELAVEMDLSFSLATIDSQLNKEYIRKALWEKRIMPLAHNEELTDEEIKNSKRIVAQMGVEPIQKAYERGGQVIVAGRTYPPALFAALPIYKGFSPGLSYHMGRILEQGGCMLGTIADEDLVVESLDQDINITPEYIAELTFFSNSGYIDIDCEKNLDISPYKVQGPAGILDFTTARFFQEGEGKVKVTGTKFTPRKKNRLRIEGAKLKGYKTHSFAGVKNPVMIKEIDTVIEDIKRQVEENFNNGVYSYNLNFGFSGLTGVMGDFKSMVTSYGETGILELGLTIETIADSQELADNITKFVKSTLHHFDYEGRVVTAENSVLPNISPEIYSSEVYAFSVCHLLESDKNDVIESEITSDDSDIQDEDIHDEEIEGNMFSISIKEV